LRAKDLNPNRTIVIPTEKPALCWLAS